MTQTISEVVRSSDANNDLLRKQCELVAAQGGSFSLTEFYVPGQCWMTRYTITWPEVKETDR